METKNTKFSETEILEAPPPIPKDGGNGKLKTNSTPEVDISRYKKRWLENVDKRFLSIFLVSLFFNVIIILYISHIPFEMTAEYARKFQEHYANFVYDKQPTPIKTEDVGNQDLIGQGKNKSGEAEKKPAETDNSGGSQGSDNAAPAGGGGAPGSASAAARRAAHSKSTAEIAQEVSNKGLLGLLTGTGSAAQGASVQDVLGETGGSGSGNLDEVLSGLNGIKTSGTAGSGSGGKGGARGGRTSGSGTGIGDLVEGLTSAKSQKFGNRTDKVVVSNSEVAVEGGKSAGRAPEQVMAVVNSHRAAINYCYQRALRKNPNLKGKISLRFVISPSGSVKDVKILSSTLNDPSVERCIISKIRSWRDFGPVAAAKGDAVFRQDYVFGY